MAATRRRADQVTPDDRVVDVRMGWEFHRGHIAGARHLGLVRALAGPRLPDGTIIVCESGHRAAVVAARRGGTVLEDGMRGWRRAGLPVQPERGGVPLWRATAVTSVLSVLFAVPHSVEDLTHGIAARVHVPVGAAALGVGTAILVQLLATLALAHGGGGARWVLAATAGTWVAGAVADHAGDLVAQHFRSGLPSRMLIVGIVATQTAVLVLVVVSLRRSATVVSRRSGGSRATPGPWY
jgi:rhodanese-related sulfurtransferase